MNEQTPVCITSSPQLKAYVERSKMDMDICKRVTWWEEIDFAGDKVTEPYIKLMNSSPGVNKIIIGYVGPVTTITLARIIPDTSNSATCSDYAAAAARFGVLLDKCTWLKKERGRFVEIHSSKDGEGEDTTVCRWGGFRPGFEKLNGYKKLEGKE